MKKILIVPFFMLLSIGAFAAHDYNIYYSQDFKVWLENNAAEIDQNSTLAIEATDLVAYMNEETSADISLQTDFDPDEVGSYDLVSVFSDVNAETNMNLMETFAAIEAHASANGTFIIGNLVVDIDGNLYNLGATGSNIPIDGGLSFLLLGGLGFGISRFKRK